MLFYCEFIAHKKQLLSQAAVYNRAAGNHFEDKLEMDSLVAVVLPDKLVDLMGILEDNHAGHHHTAADTHCLVDNFRDKVVLDIEVQDTEDRQGSPLLDTLQDKRQDIQMVDSQEHNLAEKAVLLVDSYYYCYHRQEDNRFDVIRLYFHTFYSSNILLCTSKVCI